MARSPTRAAPARSASILKSCRQRLLLRSRIADCRSRLVLQILFCRIAAARPAARLTRYAQAPPLERRRTGTLKSLARSPDHYRSKSDAGPRRTEEGLDCAGAQSC